MLTVGTGTGRLSSTTSPPPTASAIAAAVLPDELASVSQSLQRGSDAERHSKLVHARMRDECSGGGWRIGASWADGVAGPGLPATQTSLAWGRALLRGRLRLDEATGACTAIDPTLLYLDPAAVGAFGTPPTEPPPAIEPRPAHEPWYPLATPAPPLRTVKAAANLRRPDFSSPCLLLASPFARPIGDSDAWTPGGVADDLGDEEWSLIRSQASGERVAESAAELAMHAARWEEYWTPYSAKSRVRTSADLAAAAAGVASLTRAPAAHRASCRREGRADNCVGCSTLWTDAASGLHDVLRPCAPDDALQYDPLHASSLFTVSLAMAGSFVGLRRNVAATELVAYLSHVEDSEESSVLWLLVPPSGMAKLRALVGPDLHDEHSNHLPALAFIQAAGIPYLLLQQRVGQTLIVPPGWYWARTHAGTGVAMLVEWHLLRLTALCDARRQQEVSRMLGLPCRLNLTALAVAMAAAALDAVDAASDRASEEPGPARVQKRAALDQLSAALPLLQLEAVESFTGETLTPSGFLTIGYDEAMEMIVRNAVPTAMTTQRKLASTTASAPSVFRAAEDVDDEKTRCSACAVILYNLRQHCPTCDLSMCLGCYGSLGHEHTTIVRRRQPPEAITTLVAKVAELLGLAGIRSNGPQGSGAAAAASKSAASSQAARRKAASRNQSRNGGPPSKRARRADASDSAVDDDGSREREDDDDAGGESSEDRIDCVCGSNVDKGYMIFCEQCRCWLHGRCVGVTKRNTPKTFYCPRCQATSDAEGGK